jgi:hypothetical protein
MVGHSHKDACHAWLAQPCAAGEAGGGTPTPPLEFDVSRH